MGVKVINKGGRPRKQEPDAAEKQRQAEFEALTPEQKVEQIAAEVGAGDDLNSYLNEQLKLVMARKIKKVTGKSYPPPVGDSRLSINVKKEVHNKLRSSAAEKGITIGLLVEMLVINHL